MLRAAAAVIRCLSRRLLYVYLSVASVSTSCLNCQQDHCSACATAAVRYLQYHVLYFAACGLQLQGRSDVRCTAHAHHIQCECATVCKSRARHACLPTQIPRIAPCRSVPGTERSTYYSVDSAQCTDDLEASTSSTVSIPENNTSLNIPHPNAIPILCATVYVPYLLYMPKRTTRDHRRGRMRM